MARGGEDMIQDIFGENLAKHTPETLSEAFRERKGEEGGKGGVGGEEGEGDFSDPAQFANNWFLQVWVLMQRFV